MKIFTFYNFKDFELKKDKFSAFNSENNNLSGYSYTAKKNVEFVVNNNKNINYRESLICPETRLNNRLRSCFHFLDISCNFFFDDKIYITEQVTPFFKYLNKINQNLQGSEFLTDGTQFGKKNKNGILNQDLTSLTFKNNSFQKVLSFECLEHIPNYRKAISEIYRILEINGNLILTVPFLIFSKKNIIRAEVDEFGNIFHHKEPEYHGNPTTGNKLGSLCFYHFGWELIEDLKNVGFKTASVNLIWSEFYKYSGNIFSQIIIKAIK